MKIKKGRLQQIIREELTRALRSTRVLSERSGFDRGSIRIWYSDMVDQVKRGDTVTDDWNISSPVIPHPDPESFMESGAPHFGVSRLGNKRRIEIINPAGDKMIYTDDGMDYFLMPTKESDGLLWVTVAGSPPQLEKPRRADLIDGWIDSHHRDKFKKSTGEYGEERYEVSYEFWRKINDAHFSRGQNRQEMPTQQFRYYTSDLGPALAWAQGDRSGSEPGVDPVAGGLISKAEQQLLMKLDAADAFYGYDAYLSLVLVAAGATGQDKKQHMETLRNARPNRSLAAALKAFQLAHEIPASGNLDSATESLAEDYLLGDRRPNWSQPGVVGTQSVP